MALGVGTLCGIFNGILITHGRPVSGFSDSFRNLATGEVLHIPVPAIIMLVLYLIAHVILTSTKLGRYTYAIGDNEEARDSFRRQREIL